MNLSQINEFSREECEERLLLLRYLLRRENSAKVHETFHEYVQKIEKRLLFLGDGDHI